MSTAAVVGLAEQAGRQVRLWLLAPDEAGRPGMRRGNTGYFADKSTSLLAGPMVGRVLNPRPGGFLFQRYGRAPVWVRFGQVARWEPIP